MTLVHFDLRRPAVDGTDDPVVGYLSAYPTKRRVVSGHITLPVPMVIQLSEGQATADMAPTTLDWVWHVDENVPEGIVRYIVVPGSGPVEYADLVDIDPSSLDPEEPPQPQWLALAQDLQDQIDSIEIGGITDENLAPFITAPGSDTRTAVQIVVEAYLNTSPSLLSVYNTARNS